MIKVLIVDDSAVVRSTLKRALSAHGDIHVVGAAVDPYVAREYIAKFEPDVLTLDIEMPRMDGLTFLGKLMRFHPIPTVVVSSLTPQNSEMAMRALALGAVAVIPKPGSQLSVPDVEDSLIHAIRAASVAQVQPLREPSAPRQPVPDQHLETSHKILAVGASTGGTVAIEEVLREMPRNTPGTVIAQHMPPGFTRSFAERLNGICQVEVREAAEGDDVVPGVALVAPGGRHMVLVREGARYRVGLNDDPPEHFQRPAVDVLFRSVARIAGANAIGVLLTGMGSDGAQGLLAMRKAGAHTMAQDEKSCVVFGMPKEAIKLSAAETVCPLREIAGTVLNSRILRAAPTAI
ncbi:MAG: chemotaxis response regulator protein-glutamate methylesterase [Acidobacteriota bacterium]|nr:chemotaxis response regulator protein-glutamate methylesterase [Acidobacteriota bacterium]MDQ7087242.1 chemotaxis response regulator protein-glutamate methylesterase [Acidobacteriota bacterium]